ncbi:MAG TPA: response regulator [Pirellulales bacterium]|nr:response regulator [Pirellulales bacterium]
MNLDQATFAAVEPSHEPIGKQFVPSPTLLCIDDDPEISRAIQLHLRSFGVEVIRAYSGIHGYWLAVTNKPDAIITDLGMPQGRGEYVLESLKANSKTAHIPVIVLTGERNAALARRLTDIGAAAILKKPVEFQELLRILTTHLALEEAI